MQEEVIRLFDARSTPAMQAAASAVMSAGQIANGPFIEQFEIEFAEAVGRAHPVATDNMTSALVLALHLAGVGHGDEVATLAYSCLSSNSAIARVGATPVWIDITPKTSSMSYDDLVSAITPRTKAVMVYHAIGYPGPIEKISKLCQERGLVLIEDCNAAFGAEINGKSIGSFGDFAIFSFYPNRQINALDGGMLFCPDKITADRAKCLRRFGINLNKFRDSRGEINQFEDVSEIGWSCAMSNLNAAVGLAHLADWPQNKIRIRENVAQLNLLISELPGIQVVSYANTDQPGWWGVAILTQDRDEKLAKLKSTGVHASILHQRNDIYSGFRAAIRALPGTDQFQAEIMVLPCGPWLSKQDINHMGNMLQQVWSPR